MDETPDGTIREQVTIGAHVEIVQKKDQSSGKRTQGVVKRLLTKSAKHTHGIKVELETGTIGRVKKVLS